MFNTSGVALCHEKNHWTEPYEPWIGYLEYGVIVGIYLYLMWT